MFRSRAINQEDPILPYNPNTTLVMHVASRKSFHTKENKNSAYQKQ